MSAIITKYLPATKTKGARVKATCSLKSITIPYNPANNMFGNHFHAAVILIEGHKMDGFNGLISGSMPDASGYVFIPQRG